MVKRTIHSVKIKLHALLFPQKKLNYSAIEEVGTSNGKNRDEWIAQALTSLKPGLRLLDAGAGEQPYKKYCEHLQYVSQDFAQYDPKELNSGLQMQEWDYGKLDIISDVTAIPEPDASFDAVLCTEVIEHIVNPIDAIKEFYRLLKPEGTLILTAPFCSMTHFAPYHFYSGFNRFFYQEVLTSAGFTILEKTENGNYFEYLAQEIKRLESIGLSYATGPDALVKQSMNTVLEYLHESSSKDRGSKELLYFGMHVIAVKKEQRIS